MGEFNLDWFCTDIKIKRTPEVLSLSDGPGIKHHDFCAQLYDFFLFTFSPREPMTTVCKVGSRFTVLRYSLFRPSLSKRLYSPLARDLQALSPDRQTDRKCDLLPNPKLISKSCA